MKIKKNKSRKLINFLGNTLTVLSLILIFEKILDLEINIIELRNSKTYLFVSCSIVLQTILVICSYFPWYNLLYFFSNKIIPSKIVLKVFLNANLLKYIPGNIFHYIGRNKIAVDYSLEHSDVFSATVIDILCGLCVGLIFSTVIFLNFIFNNIFKKNTVFIFGLVLIFLLVRAIICIVVKKIKGKLKLFQRLFSKKGIKELRKITLYYLFQNVMTVIMVALTCYGIFFKYDIKSLFIIGCAYIFASVIGTLTPGAPGGLGIREMVMVYITKNIIYMEDALILITVLRVVSIIGDFMAFFVFNIFYYVMKRFKYAEKNKF